MIPFATTAEQKVKVATFAAEMSKAGLQNEFVSKAMDLAMTDQGVYDLLALWSETSDGSEREEIVADIQELIDDDGDAPKGRVEKPELRFDQLDDVIVQVRKFKDHLRKIIDSKGGVSAVARMTGIPQPSLSRMLNSGSMPRRSTLYKIANALGLPESEIVTEWVR